MGQPCVSLHVRGASTRDVANAMSSIVRRRATISSVANDWVTVWDETSEHNSQELERVARELSTAIAAPVIALSVSKSEVIYLIYARGNCLDRYNSQPDYYGYYGDVSATESAAVVGRAEVLTRLARSGTELRQLEAVLHDYDGFDDSGMEWERARGASLTDLLGIRRGRVDPRWEPDDDSTDGFVEVENSRGVLCQELFEAIKACHVAGVASLLDQGLSIDAVDDYGQTTLQRAVETEYPDYAYVSPDRLQVVRLLIARGAARSNIQAALPGAALRGAVPLVVALVDAGADGSSMLPSLIKKRERSPSEELDRMIDVLRSAKQ